MGNFYSIPNTVRNLLYQSNRRWCLKSSLTRNIFCHQCGNYIEFGHKNTNWSRANKIKIKFFLPNSRHMCDCESIQRSYSMDRSERNNNCGHMGTWLFAKTLQRKSHNFKKMKATKSNRYFRDHCLNLQCSDRSIYRYIGIYFNHFKRRLVLEPTILPFTLGR